MTLSSPSSTAPELTASASSAGSRVETVSAARGSVSSDGPSSGVSGGARVKIRAVASYNLQRVKLNELEKVVRWQPSTQKKWHVTADRDWTVFSLRPDDSTMKDDADPASRKVGNAAGSCKPPGPTPVSTALTGACTTLFVCSFS